MKLYIACSGRRVLQLGAQVADGLILAMGFSDDNLAYINNEIECACAAVNRDPAELDIWWHCTLHFGDSRESAMADNIGLPISWMTMRTMEGKQIPPITDRH